MSNYTHTEPNANDSPIIAEMKTISRICIDRRLAIHRELIANARKFKASGDYLHRAGFPQRAARNHSCALRNLVEAAEAAVQILDLCAEWDWPPPPEIMPEVKWGVAECPSEKSTEHHGVGEGDSGLPQTAGEGGGGGAVASPPIGPVEAASGGSL